MIALSWTDYLLGLQLEAVENVTIYGPRPERGRAALCSFNVKGVHPTDISTVLDLNGEAFSLKLDVHLPKKFQPENQRDHYLRLWTGVAVRSGHQCTQPLHAALGLSASVRASLYLYNTAAEIDSFIRELKDAIGFFTA